MTTFSQLIDDMVAESRRLDMRSEIVSFARQTIRDVHFNRSNTEMIEFGENRRELAVSAATDSYVWNLPSQQSFARLEAIYCPAVGEYAIERKPSTIHREDVWRARPSWYRTGPSIAVANFGGADSEIHFSWFEFPRALDFYSVATRPAVWNRSTETFTYLPAYDVDDTTRENAQLLTTNWLLIRWEELIKEGVRAKLYKRLADEVRMRAAYSAFESARVAMVAAETYTGMTQYAE